MSTATYEALMPKLLAREALDEAQARRLMAEVVRGDLGAARIAAVLTALACREVDGAELAGFAAVLRERAHHVPVQGMRLDTCGTGGSGLSTANTSSMSAFVLAAAGVPVTKHGNRKSSGRCGSIDVLERLGVHVEIGPQKAAALLAAHGVVFLFAPLFHPAIGMVMPVRRELGFRTVFNLLGPLANPAAATHQVLGVSDAAAAPHMAGALLGLGVQRAIVVRGDDGLDELSLSAPSTLWHADAADPAGTPRVERVTPEDVGLQRAPAAAVAGGDPAENAAIFEAVLSGADRGPHADHVALNAGAGLLVTGRAASLREGVEQARALLHAGAAWTRFCAYRDATQALAEAA